MTPAVIRANQVGNLAQVDLSRLQSTNVELTKTADDGVTFWRDIPATTFTVTDLDFVNGSLYLSGLSTGEFSSTLRKIPYPFKGGGKTTHVRCETQLLLFPSPEVVARGVMMLAKSNDYAVGVSVFADREGFGYTQVVVNGWPWIVAYDLEKGHEP